MTANTATIWEGEAFSWLRAPRVRTADVIFYASLLLFFRTQAPESLPDYQTARLPRCHTATLLHCHTATLPHCYTATLPHCHTATLPHCHIATLPHCQNATLPHRYTATLSHCYTATLPSFGPDRAYSLLPEAVISTVHLPPTPRPFVSLSRHTPRRPPP